MVAKIELLFVLACIAFTSVTGEEIQIQPQPIPQNSTTVVPPTTTNATTTTAIPTTTTPTTANTTTIPTSPTTPAPTTTKEPTSTTTTSTTTAVPTTPAPVPKPDTGMWNVTENNVNKTYILAKMAVQLNITYDTVTNKTQHAILDIPKNAIATGNYGNDTQSLNITWLNKDNTTRNHFIMLFEKNDTENCYMIRNITLSITPTKDVFPDIKDNSTIELYNNKTEFSTPLHKSYRCAKEQTFDLMKTGSNKTYGAVTLSNVQLEAFHEKMDALFDTAEDCEKSTSSDIVPIAVGCALGGLVVIVLIAYLVGRRRSQTRGYLSM